MAGLELERKQSSPRSHVPRLYTASLFCPNIWKLTEIAAPEPESRPRWPPLRFRSDPKEAFGEPSRVASLAAASSHPCAYAQPRPSWREETGQDSEGETALLLTSGPSSSSISEAPARNTSSRAAAATVAAAAIPRSLTSGSCQSGESLPRNGTTGPGVSCTARNRSQIIVCLQSSCFTCNRFTQVQMTCEILKHNLPTGTFVAHTHKTFTNNKENPHRKSWRPVQNLEVSGSSLRR